RERDVVRKLGVVKPKETEHDKKAEADKAKEPFKDRVLEKALDYLRGKVKQANVGKANLQKAQDDGLRQAAPPAGRSPLLPRSAWAWSWNAERLIYVASGRPRFQWA